MTRRRRIYEGKAKVLYEGPEPGTLVQYFKDDATAFNNQKRGTITGKDISGSVQAESTFAAMDIACAGPSLVCRNQSGALRLRATSASLAKVDARTSFGSIELTLLSSLHPVIQARTAFADIDSDFPVMLKPRGQDAFAGVAGGIARINLETQNGRIRIARAE